LDYERVGGTWWPAVWIIEELPLVLTLLVVTLLVVMSIDASGRYLPPISAAAAPGKQRLC
jgi:hypothetical protein